MTKEILILPIINPQAKAEPEVVVDKSTVITAHGLAIGDSVFSDTTGFVKADNKSSKPAQLVVSKVIDTNKVELVGQGGVIEGATGLVNGDKIYLGVAGKYTKTKPTESGEIVQQIGFYSERKLYITINTAFKLP